MGKMRGNEGKWGGMGGNGGKWGKWGGNGGKWGEMRNPIRIISPRGAGQPPPPPQGPNTGQALLQGAKVGNTGSRVDCRCGKALEHVVKFTRSCIDVDNEHPPTATGRGIRAVSRAVRCGGGGGGGALVRV